MTASEQWMDDAPVPLTAGALIRLAGALDTTVSKLRASRRRTPVRGLAALHPVLDHVCEDECLRLLAPGGTGRVAFEVSGRLSVLPVTFALHDRKVVFSTDATAAIAQYGEGPVAFEVDRIDEGTGEGWSVLISGNCRHSLEEMVALRKLVDPWTDGRREVLVVIEPEHLSGRRIRTW